MSADKYAQFIAEQQKKLSVSGTNPVNLSEKKELSDKQKDIAKLAGDEDKIEGEDFKELRDKKDDEDDDKDDDKKSKSKKDDDDKDVKEEVEQLDEIGNTQKGQKALKRYREKSGREIGNYEDEMGTDDYGEFAHGSGDEDADRKYNNRTAGYDRANSRINSRSKVYNKKSMAANAKNNAAEYKNSQKFLKSLNKKKKIEEEASYISEEESDYLAEMVVRGKLPEIADFHKKAADHAYKMTRHHSMMADKSEEVGDADGFDHHIDRAMKHEYDHEHHLARYDHAVSLKARNKANNDLKTAKQNATKARDAKRDWA
jgi:hypothetical protein